MTAVLAFTVGRSWRICGMTVASRKNVYPLYGLRIAVFVSMVRDFRTQGSIPRTLSRWTLCDEELKNCSTIEPSPGRSCCGANFLLGFLGGRGRCRLQGQAVRHLLSGAQYVAKSPE